MNDFFKLPVTLMEAMSENDMMLVVGGDKVVVEYTVVNEGNGCNVEGALNIGLAERGDFMGNEQNSPHSPYNDKFQML